MSFYCALKFNSVDKVLSFHKLEISDRINNPQIKSTTVGLQLGLLGFCLLGLIGETLCDGKGAAAIRVFVKEDSDVTLPCSLSTEELKLFDWRRDDQKGVFLYDGGLHSNNGRSGQSEQFKGRVFHFEGEEKHGNASITIRNTKMADSGDYTCDFPLQQRRFHVKLVVVAAPEPDINILEGSDDGVLLQCEIHGASPEPAVEWRDSSGNKLPAKEPQVSERGGSYDIILQTTVTKTDNYQCVVTQETISHQTEATIHVYIRVDNTRNIWAMGMC